MPSRGRMAWEVRWVVGWTHGLWACGGSEGSLCERMAQPTAPFFQGPRRFPGCGFFKANVEMICSKLGISSPYQMDGQRTRRGWMERRTKE